MVEVLIHGGPLAGRTREFSEDEPPAEWSVHAGLKSFHYKRAQSLINGELRWLFIPLDKKGLEK